MILPDGSWFEDFEVVVKPQGIPRKVRLWWDPNFSERFRKDQGYGWRPWILCFVDVRNPRGEREVHSFRGFRWAGFQQKAECLWMLRWQRGQWCFVVGEWKATLFSLHLWMVPVCSLENFECRIPGKGDLVSLSLSPSKNPFVGRSRAFPECLGVALH